MAGLTNQPFLKPKVHVVVDAWSLIGFTRSWAVDTDGAGGHPRKYPTCHISSVIHYTPQRTVLTLISSDPSVGASCLPPKFLDHSSASTHFLTCNYLSPIVPTVQMAAKSTSSPNSTLGRVLAVLRKRKPIDENSSWTIATALSNSFPMLTIGSQHYAAAAQRPVITTADPSSDDSCRLRVQEGVKTALTLAAPIFGAIPLAGSPLKAAVDGLLEILKAADAKNTFRYASVAQRINECCRDIDHYLMRYNTLGIMRVENAAQRIEANLEMFLPLASTLQLRRSAITGIVLIDATGKRYEVSMDCAKSYELFTKTIAHFFDGDKMEARIQRRYIEQDRYDLCIDHGNQIVPINGQPDWPKVESGMQLVMRAILVQEKKNQTRRYQCPRCKTWNILDDGGGELDRDLLIECRGCDGRFQISKADRKYTSAWEWGSRNTREDENGISHDTEMGVLVNFHLKEYHAIVRTSMS
ncbi:uncharacterized protein LACBIDRAFT_332960 [Laccaria bicolor S238N-H82]|uniref:Predicted protein n=1 Tax=Laccaria bicolor (strain S238N-H82 / ATCC MYA-4686) TaxID=486041 RepID=B0DUE6_LACBS|nr:uncharacterized protein LACBIDRAFT_332960 [Laccaria bicolor S238N-H82]EDR01728.1 predicted protein [Laccaria bicolor S238N-H82]|eukprot:XP_001887541.1 predicted protein [Laccaria bicolor S238N-H82]